MCKVTEMAIMVEAEQELPRRKHLNTYLLTCLSGHGVTVEHPAIPIGRWMPCWASGLPGSYRFRKCEGSEKLIVGEVDIFLNDDRLQKVRVLTFELDERQIAALKQQGKEVRGRALRIRNAEVRRNRNPYALPAPSTVRFCSAYLRGEILMTSCGPVRAEDLFQLYRTWCKRNGESPMPRGRLRRVMERHHHFRVARKRWQLNGLDHGPCVVLTPDTWAPDGESQSESLGRSIGEFRVAAMLYRQAPCAQS
jgi:hypothetical protein